MEWWQEVLGLVIALGWWRMTLIVVAILFIGILSGVSLTYLIIRFLHKDHVRFLDFFYLLFSKKPKVFTLSFLAQQSISIPGAPPEVQELVSTPSAPLEVHEPVKFPVPELLAEFQHNRRIVTEFSGDNLLPLQTDAWDAHRYSAQKLPANLREQLEQVYADIHSLNTVVWFATELGHKSSFLEEEYRRLLTSIAERLQRIKPDIEYSALIERPGQVGNSEDGAKVHEVSHFSG